MMNLQYMRDLKTVLQVLESSLEKTTLKSCQLHLSSCWQSVGVASLQLNRTPIRESHDTLLVRTMKRS